MNAKAWSRSLKLFTLLCVLLVVAFTDRPASDVSFADLLGCLSVLNEHLRVLIEYILESSSLDAGFLRQLTQKFSNFSNSSGA